MLSMPRSGALVVSVDVPVPGARSSGDERQLEPAVTALLAILSQCKCPATFAFSDPVASRLVDRVLLAGGHEVAILADASWAAAAGTNSARELVRRLLRSRAAGFAVSTVSLHVPSLDLRWDLAAKQGVTAVRSASCSPRATGSRTGWRGWAQRLNLKSPALLQPRAARFGLWELAPHIGLPTSGESRARGAIDRAAREHALAVVSIDVAALAHSGRNGLRAVERLLAYAVALKARRALPVHTVAAAVARLTAQTKATPARSILSSRAA